MLSMIGCSSARIGSSIRAAPTDGRRLTVGRARAWADWPVWSSSDEEGTLSCAPRGPTNWPVFGIGIEGFFSVLTDTVVGSSSALEVDGFRSNKSG